MERSRTNRAVYKMNASLNKIARILADDEELRKLLFYPSDTLDDNLVDVTKTEVINKCTDIVANYPDSMESIGGFLVIGIPEGHRNKNNPKYFDIVLTIDIMVHEGSEKFGVGLKALEIFNLIDYLLTETDIQGIGLLKLKDFFYQVYTPTVKGYTIVFTNRDMN